jgi:hypothetical protein
VVRFLNARLDRLFADVDGVRVDHPHGLVCPWVYDARRGDDACAVRDGARLFESPALPDHPELSAFAIARPDQVNPDPRTPRYADEWVVALDAEQVHQYAVLVDAIVAAARRHGRGRRTSSARFCRRCRHRSRACSRPTASAGFA